MFQLRLDAGGAAVGNPLCPCATFVNKIGKEFRALQAQISEPGWFHNVQLMKGYSVVNTTNYSFIVSRYSIDDKLHVSALWWPSSVFEQVSEERTCYFTFSFGSEISDRPSGITKSMVVNPSLYYTN
jgi:hypothetical protein